ncbi:MAG: transposase [Bacteroidetes bacterium]|nr:transposase [Bacteroidota bacterium]MCL5031135.1 transposase [Bacteroidota bacterium]
MQQRKHYTAEQKVMILRELLENNVPISQLAEKYEVRPYDIYNCPEGMPLAEEKIV